MTFHHFILMVFFYQNYALVSVGSFTFCGDGDLKTYIL